MAGLRFTELQSRPMEFLDFTSLTLDAFQHLVPPFEAAFHARMAAWRMDGKPRTARRFAVDKNCPLPTSEDRLLFILVYLKTYALQVVHGRLFGMVQGKANQLRLSRFKLAGLPTPRDTEVSNASAIIHDSLGPVCICSLSGINSDADRPRDASRVQLAPVQAAVVAQMFAWYTDPGQSEAIRKHSLAKKQIW